MTKEEAITQLKDLSTVDPEVSHIDADYILLNFLADNGFVEIADAYRETSRRVGFWYA